MADATFEEKKKQQQLPFSLPDVSKIDLNKISPKNEPDYIPSSIGGRDFYGQASFNTGVMWLGGYVCGGAYGFVEGWRTAANPSFKIRFNSVMNAFNKRGSRAGNALGIIGMLLFVYFVVLSHLMCLAFGHTAGVHAANYIELDRLTGLDVSTPLFAGLVTGVVYKSTRGPRAAALAGVIGMAASTAYWYGSSFVIDTVLGRGGRF